MKEAYKHRKVQLLYSPLVDEHAKEAYKRSSYGRASV